ncbi:MAG TPA: tetratricopeptide repeat protein [Polyangiaceae bacterium]
MRRSISRTALIAWAAAGAFLSASAHAQEHAPTLWERALDPARSEAERQAHREAQLYFADAQQQRSTSQLGQEQISKAMHVLDEVHADTSPDVRLRFDAGYALSMLGEYDRAAPVLESALRDGPDHPRATEGYFQVAICYAKQYRPEEEIQAYDEFLRRETDSGSRAQALSNRGEAQMLIGRLTPAIADYRASLVLEPDSPLTHWGLAVALDRNGDMPGALTEANTAITYDPLDQRLESSDVFFMPPYDRYWYEGIGAMARAGAIDDAATSTLWWETAVGKWRDYIGLATSDDRWLALAKAHLASCDQKLTKAQKRASQAAKASDGAKKRKGGGDAP